MKNWKSPGTNGSEAFSIKITSTLKHTVMPKEKNYKWKLGLFSVAALVLAIAAVYYIGKQKNKFGSVLHVSALFNSVSGLKAGSNVRLGGIDIGTVDGISLVTDTSVQVDMIIQRKVQKFIKKDAKAAISSEGLMGDKVITIAADPVISYVVAERKWHSRSGLSFD